MPIELTGPQAQRIREAVAQLKSDLDNGLKVQIGGALGPHAGVPAQLSQFMAALATLYDAVWAGSAIEAPATVPDGLAPMLATVIGYFRRSFVTDLEERRARAVAGELLHNLDATKASVDALLTAYWYLATTPLRVPRLRDFVADSRAEAAAGPVPHHPRQLEDKFGILWSPSHLLPDFDVMRRECARRSAPVAIAFVDVDALKALNTRLGETWVDALVLPPIMRTVERAVYGHGFAYRHGGDEFVLLIPSAGEEVAVALLRALQRDMSSLMLENLPEPPTVSIGLCVLDPDSPVTDREALHWAALAKRQAKAVHNAIAVVAAGKTIGEPKATIVGLPARSR